MNKLIIATSSPTALSSGGMKWLRVDFVQSGDDISDVLARPPALRGAGGGKGGEIGIIRRMV